MYNIIVNNKYQTCIHALAPGQNKHEIVCKINSKWFNLNRIENNRIGPFGIEIESNQMMGESLQLYLLQDYAPLRNI